MIEPAVPGEEESDEFGDLVAEVTQNLTAVQSERSCGWPTAHRFWKSQKKRTSAGPPYTTASSE